jgi:hypothetical protein
MIEHTAVGAGGSSFIVAEATSDWDEGASSSGEFL